MEGSAFKCRIMYRLSNQLSHPLGGPEARGNLVRSVTNPSKQEFYSDNPLVKSSKTKAKPRQAPIDHQSTADLLESLQKTGSSNRNGKTWRRKQMSNNRGRPDSRDGSRK